MKSSASLKAKHLPMKVLLPLLLSLTLISCRDDFPGRSETSGTRLTEVYFDKDKVYVYEYNSDGLLAVEKSKWLYSAYRYEPRVVYMDLYEDPGLYSSSSVISEKSLNRKDWVSPQNTKKTTTVQYRLDQDKKLISSTERTPDAWMEYIYGDGSRITEVRMYYSGQLGGVREYTYDSNGNLTRDEHYSILKSGERQVNSITEYEFDQGKNPYFHLAPARLPGERTNPNNITRKKYSVSGYPDSETRYTYTYNSDGYPVSRDQGDMMTYYKYGN